MYTITLNDEQLAIINAALQEMPHKIVVPLFSEINRQLAESNSKKEDRS